MDGVLRSQRHARERSDWNLNLRSGNWSIYRERGAWLRTTTGRDRPAVSLEEQIHGWRRVTSVFSFLNLIIWCTFHTPNELLVWVRTARTSAFLMPACDTFESLTEYSFI